MRSISYRDMDPRTSYIAAPVRDSLIDREVDQEFEEERQRQATLERLGREIDMDKLLGPD